MNDQWREVNIEWAKQMVDKYALTRGDTFGGLLKEVSEETNNGEFWLLLAENLRLIIGDANADQSADTISLVKRVLKDTGEEQYGARFELLVASKLKSKFECHIQTEHESRFDLMLQRADFPDLKFKIETKMLRRQREAPLENNQHPGIVTQPLDLTKEETIIRRAIQAYSPLEAPKPYDLLLIDISPIGTSWIRSIDIWGSILKEWYPVSDLKPDAPVIALTFTSLDSPLIRLAHTDLKNLDEVKRNFAQSVFDTLRV